MPTHGCRWRRGRAARATVVPNGPNQPKINSFDVINQSRHERQGHQGLGLAWILRNRTLHCGASSGASLMWSPLWGALPAKNQPWRPWISRVFFNQISADLHLFPFPEIACALYSKTVACIWMSSQFQDLLFLFLAGFCHLAQLCAWSNKREKRQITRRYMVIRDTVK